MAMLVCYSVVLMVFFAPNARNMSLNPLFPRLFQPDHVLVPELLFAMEQVAATALLIRIFAL